MAKGLTEKQKNILEFIIDFQRENGYPPTIRELGDAFSIGSLRGVTVHLDALVRKGFMTRSRTSRSIRVIGADPRDPAGTIRREETNAVRLPLLRDAPTSEKLPTEGNVEQFISLPCDLATPATPEGFVVRVGATGVHGEPVVPGDLLVVRPQQDATLGELIVIRSHGDLTITRATGDHLDIVGRVVGMIRRY